MVTSDSPEAATKIRRRRKSRLCFRSAKSSPFRMPEYTAVATRSRHWGATARSTAVTSSGSKMLKRWRGTFSFFVFLRGFGPWNLPSSTAALTALERNERRLFLVWGALADLLSRNSFTLTGGGEREWIPMAAALVPYLKAACDQHPNSELVFPATNGKQHPAHVDLVARLQAAMRRAGLVEKYTHTCRRKGCGYTEDHRDDAQRRCPKCEMRLWPVAHVRHLRFHDLRHTTASLLTMAGVPITAVQRVLRHSDPRLTANTYSHLAPDFLQGQIDTLKFGEADEVGSDVTPLLPDPEEEEPDPEATKEESPGKPGPLVARPEGFEPPTFGSVDREGPSSGGNKRSQVVGFTQGREARVVQNSHRVASPTKDSATPLLPASAVGRLLTVKEVAALLRVCVATVYSLVESGRLPHVRVLNSIRVPSSCLETLVGK